MIKQYFKTLGFSSKETMIYLCLAQQGEASAPKISKRCNIPRTSIYPLLKNLIERNLVVKNNHPGADTFCANDPSSLFDMLVSDHAEISKKEKIISQVANILSPYFHKEIQYYEGASQITQAIETHLNTFTKNKNSSLWCYLEPEIISYYKETNFVENSNIIVSKKKSDFLSKPLKAQHINLFKIDINLKFSLFCDEHRITMIQTASKPHYAIQIKNPLFAAGIQSLLQFTVCNS